MIPFEIPAEWLGKLASGEVVRYGAILKNVADGRIVAHVQQTSMLENVLSHGLSFDPTGVGTLFNAVQSYRTNLKLDQIQASLEFLQSLNIATFATSVAGIGVTVASTAILMRKLDKVEDRLASLEARVEALPRAWRDMNLRGRLNEVSTAVERLGEVGLRRSPEEMVRSSEEVLHREFNHLAEGLGHVVSDRQVDAELVQALLAGLSLCGSAEIRALFWLDELELARQRAGRHYEALEALARRMPQDLMARRLVGGRETAAALSRTAGEVRALVASQPALAARLQELDVSGRDYLDRIAAEEDEPLLLLPAGEASQA